MNQSLIELAFSDSRPVIYVTENQIKRKSRCLCSLLISETPWCYASKRENLKQT